jgi:hypothetical protein
MIRTLAPLTILALALTVAAAPPSSPPGQEPCSHGESGRTCRPDPRPSRGEDCDEHGPRDGVDEDHCPAADDVSAGMQREVDDHVERLTPPGSDVKITLV